MADCTLKSELFGQARGGGRDFEVTEDSFLASLFLRYGTTSRRRLLQFIEQGVNPTGIAVRQFVTLDGFNSVTSSGG